MSIDAFDEQRYVGLDKRREVNASVICFDASPAELEEETSGVDVDVIQFVVSSEWNPAWNSQTFNRGDETFTPVELVEIIKD
jgi:hypothetical protein